MLRPAAAAGCADTAGTVASRGRAGAAAAAGCCSPLPSERNRHVCLHSFAAALESPDSINSLPPPPPAPQGDVNEKMRAILVDWLVDVHLKFKLMPETLFLTTNLIDRFLEAKQVTRKHLQLVRRGQRGRGAGGEQRHPWPAWAALAGGTSASCRAALSPASLRESLLPPQVGVTAMLVASKYEEIWAPEVRDFVYISDRAYTRDQILNMEKIMLNVLRFNLTVPTPFNFLARFFKAAGCAEDK